MARRGWDFLSAGYRQRLERQGVSRSAYESGASLQQARGHKSAGHERAQSKSYRNIDRWVHRFSEAYGRDPDDVREAVTQYGRVEAERVIRFQQQMERMYDEGRTQAATTRYKLPRKHAYPDWLFFYHGTFS